jgi:hypothetical protein
VIARFSDEKDTAIQIAKNKIGDNVSSPWPPHITIAAYENMEEADLQALLDWSAAYCSKNQQFNIGMISLSILPPGGEHTDTAVVCLNPAHSKTLVDFYYGFHERFEDFCTGIGWYNSIRHGNPVMHCTIGVVQLAQSQQALQSAFDTDGLFGYTDITALEVYTYPYRLIKRFEMEGRRQ